MLVCIQLPVFHILTCNPEFIKPQIPLYMNITSMQLMAGVTELEATLGTATPEQRAIIGNLKKQIRENGLFFEVTSASLTVESMREHGYDVTDEDAGILSKIAGHVEVDADMLWNAVEIWAREYNVKSIKEEEE